jgi:hypothetical protein
VLFSGPQGVEFLELKGPFWFVPQQVMILLLIVEELWTVGKVEYFGAFEDGHCELDAGNEMEKLQPPIVGIWQG